MTQIMKTRIVNWMPLMAATMAAVSLAACTSKPPAPTVVVMSEAEIGAKEAKIQELRRAGKHAEAAALSNEVSEEWARMGELLLMPEGVVHADKLFDRSLGLNPSNNKANFYKSQTGILMAFKGYFTLGEGLVSHNQNGAEAIELGRREIHKLKMPEVAMFSFELQQGDVPWTTYYQAQRFLREKLYVAVQKSLMHIDRIDTAKPLKLNVTPERMMIDPTRVDYHYSSSYTYCHSDPQTGYQCRTSSYGYDYETKKLPNEQFLDRHDIQIYRMMMQTALDSIRLGTAYSFENSEHAIRKMRAIDAINKKSGLRGISAKEVVEVLKLYPTLMKLENDQELPQLAHSTSEVLRRTLDFASMKHELCDSKERDSSNSLIHPICIGAEAVESIQISLDALAGPKEVELGRDRLGRKVMIVMDMSRVLRTPVRDLKALLPTSFDQSGAPTGWPDPTMGGLFPNGDLIDKLKEISSHGREIDRAMRDLRRALRDAGKYVD